MNDIEYIQQRFENEVTTAAIAFYTWKSINTLASKDKAVYFVMNKDALTWNAFTYSLQTTALITLGRIFDTDNGALSVHSYLNKCIAEIVQFSPEHLKRRKLRQINGNHAPWLDEYISKADFPTKADFRNLKREARQYQRQYESIYKPIRNQVLAHSELSTIGKTEALFAKTRISDIQNILEFLYQLSQVVFQFLQNGKRSNLKDFNFKKEEEVTKDVESLLNRLLN